MIYMKTMILDDIAKHLKTEISTLPYGSKLQLEAMKFVSQNNEKYTDEEIRYAVIYLFQTEKGV